MNCNGMRPIKRLMSTESQNWKYRVNVNPTKDKHQTQIHQQALLKWWSPLSMSTDANIILKHSNLYWPILLIISKYNVSMLTAIFVMECFCAIVCTCLKREVCESLDNEMRAKPSIVDTYGPAHRIWYLSQKKLQYVSIRVLSESSSISIRFVCKKQSLWQVSVWNAGLSELSIAKILL